MKNYKRTTSYVPENTTDHSETPAKTNNPKTTKGSKGTVKTTKSVNVTPTTQKKTTGKIRSRGEVIPIKARMKRGF